MIDVNQQFDAIFKPTFSLQFIKDVKSTWQAISSDVADMCICNEDCLEMCFDADRLEIYGSKESNNELKKLASEFSMDLIYTKLTNFVSLY